MTMNKIINAIEAARKVAHDDMWHTYPATNPRKQAYIMLCDVLAFGGAQNAAEAPVHVFSEDVLKQDEPAKRRGRPPKQQEEQLND